MRKLGGVIFKYAETGICVQFRGSFLKYVLYYTSCSPQS